MVKNLVRTSKFLSLVLRHKPQRIGIILDPQGWVNVDELITAANRSGTQLNRALIEQVVAQNNKQRFTFSEDGRRIRANQGHSIPVELDLEPLLPPAILYHGTATRFIESIQRQGLLAGNRNHVHLSKEEETAIRVGQRHGKPMVLHVGAGKMYEQGHQFYCSKNGVWLTDHVPVKFILFPS